MYIIIIYASHSILSTKIFLCVQLISPCGTIFFPAGDWREIKQGNNSFNPWLFHSNYGMV